MSEENLSQAEDNKCENCKNAIICVECKRKICTKEGEYCRISGYFATINGPTCIDCYEKKDKK